MNLEPFEKGAHRQDGVKSGTCHGRRSLDEPVQSLEGPLFSWVASKIFVVRKFWMCCGHFSLAQVRRRRACQVSEEQYPNYSKVIQRPIALVTMRQRLKGRYLPLGKGVDRFREDMELMFDNAKR
jgi:hypothetical protein